MSNELSVATVTAALKHIIGPAVPGGTVTSRSLDKARQGSGNQLNLFLYHTSLSAAWRNAGGGHAPLALILYYLVTAYGTDDEDVAAHRTLGRTMALLHDHPQLTAQDISAGIADESLDNESVLPDLGHQAEPIRITWHPLSLEELSRLWGGMQTALRFSVAYEVAVVLLDSQRSDTAAPPVLQRGRTADDIPAHASLDPPVPTLRAITPPAGQVVAQDGDTLRLSGSRFKVRDADTVVVCFQHPRFGIVQRLNAPGATATEVVVTLPTTAPGDWPVSVYSVFIETSSTDPDTGVVETRETNALSLALGPHLLTLTPSPAAPADGDDVTLTVSFRPAVREGQRVRLLFGAEEVEPASFSAPAETLDFTIPVVRTGVHPVRLRIDGFESRLIPDRTARPPAYDPAHRLTVP